MGNLGNKIRLHTNFKPSNNPLLLKHDKCSFTGRRVFCLSRVLPRRTSDRYAVFGRCTGWLFENEIDVETMTTCNTVNYEKLYAIA
jgi:hypothetical protein